MSSAFPVLYHDHRAGVSGRSGAESDTDTCMRTLGTVQTSTTTTCKQSEPGAASRSSSIDSILWWELCSFCSIFIIWVARLQVFTFWDLHSSHHISDGFYLLCKFAFLFNEIIDSETEKNWRAEKFPSIPGFRTSLFIRRRRKMKRLLRTRVILMLRGDSELSTSWGRARGKGSSPAGKLVQKMGWCLQSRTSSTERKIVHSLE